MTIDRKTAQLALDHAWRYFELHANQRMVVFNFFCVLAGFNAAGLGATLQGSARFSSLGAALGLILALLSFVFWKLDQRTAFFIKHAEEVLAAQETKLMDPAARIFCAEPSRYAGTLGQGVRASVWTFGRSLRLTFMAMACIGLAGAGLSTLRFAGVISLEEAGSVQADSNPASAAGTAKAAIMPAGTTDGNRAGR